MMLNKSRTLGLSFAGTDESDWTHVNRLIDMGLIEIFITRLPTNMMGPKLRFTREGVDFMIDVLGVEEGTIEI